MSIRAITTEEWIAELEKLSARSGDQGMSIEELSRATRLGRDAMRDHMKRLMGMGRLRSGRRPSMSIDGRPCWTPVYWVEGSKNKKKPGGKP